MPLMRFQLPGGYSVNPTAPTANQVLAWNSATLQWTATTLVAANLPATIVYTNQSNTYGAFNQIYPSSQLFIQNPAATFNYIIAGSAITVANRTLTLPLITGTDTLSVLGLAQTYSAARTFTVRPILSIGLTHTAIADPAAAAGIQWLSSTNVDVIKYSSATTIFNVLSTKGAVATNTSAAPAGTASLTAVMMAIGGAITPLTSSRVRIVVSGQLSNNTLNDGATVDLRFGTGVAPVNGAAVTGTLVGISQTMTALVAAARSGFCISGMATGLAIGTAIWVDVSLLAVTAGTATVTGVTVSLSEV